MWIGYWRAAERADALSERAAKDPSRQTHTEAAEAHAGVAYQIGQDDTAQDHHERHVRQMRHHYDEAAKHRRGLAGPVLTMFRTTVNSGEMPDRRAFDVLWRKRGLETQGMVRGELAVMIAAIKEARGGIKVHHDDGKTLTYSADAAGTWMLLESLSKLVYILRGTRQTTARGAMDRLLRDIGFTIA